MTKNFGAVFFVLFFALSQSVSAQQRTVINSDYAGRMLLGRHFLSLQWISWDRYGRAHVRNRKGVYHLGGVQTGRGNNDKLEIDGVVTEINRYDFKFRGKITTVVSHINGGNECVRKGDMTFAITGKRKYWRLQEMDNPCDTATDYVDIYFRR